MMEALRRGASTWVAKLLIGLLVLSFAVWGISDIFGGYGANSLAEVGDREISAEQYRRAHQTEIRRFSNQLGRLMSADEARALGLDSRVMTRLVGEAALGAHANELNLGITDKAIAQQTVNVPAFQDASGNFNRQLFNELLQANGLSEESYVALERDASVRRQLTDTVGDVGKLPEVLLQAANRYQNETRTLSYFTLPAGKLEPIAAPTEAQLKTYYDNHKNEFTAPEYRKLGVLIVTPELLASTVEVSEEDIKQQYEAQKESFGTPERRHVLQMAFQDPETAKKAYEKLEQGADFMQVAKENGFADGDVDLGEVTKSDLSDPKVADTAFQLQSGKVSEPIDGRLSTVIVKVTNVTPGVEKSLDDVRDQIRKTLAEERAAEEVLDLHDKVEDERAAGKALAEIANQLNLKYVEIPAVDRNGNTPDDKPIDVPAANQMVAAAFKSDVGVENDYIETPDRGVMWMEVQGVTPRKLKPLQEVRGDVEQAWRRSEERSRLSKRAQELVERIRKGETLQAAAQSLGLEVSQSAPLKRSAQAEGLPPAAIAQAFALGDGSVGSAPTDDGSARVIFKVAQVTPPPPLSEAQAKALRDAMQTQVVDDLVSQYVTGLRDGYGVRVNQDLLNQLTGRESG